jgi:hypothetical protein
MGTPERALKLTSWVERSTPGTTPLLGGRTRWLTERTKSALQGRAWSRTVTGICVHRPDRDLRFHEPKGTRVSARRFIYVELRRFSDSGFYIAG